MAVWGGQGAFSKSSALRISPKPIAISTLTIV